MIGVVVADIDWALVAMWALVAGSAVYVLGAIGVAIADRQDRDPSVAASGMLLGLLIWLIVLGIGSR